MLGTDTTIATDDVWVVDSTPVDAAVQTDGPALGTGRLG